MFSVYHDQKDGSEFSDVTLASEDDNDNSDVKGEPKKNLTKLVFQFWGQNQQWKPIRICFPQKGIFITFQTKKPYPFIPYVAHTATI